MGAHFACLSLANIKCPPVSNHLRKPLDKAPRLRASKLALSRGLWCCAFFIVVTRNFISPALKGSKPTTSELDKGEQTHPSGQAELIRWPLQLNDRLVYGLVRFDSPGSHASLQASVVSSILACTSTTMKRASLVQCEPPLHLFEAEGPSRNLFLHHLFL